MTVALAIPGRMTLAEFLAWDAPAGVRWQLVDGVPQAMAPASPTHARLQNELGSLLRNHLHDRRSPCVVVANAGVIAPNRDRPNYRIPDLAVTCTEEAPGDPAIHDPVLIVEILSPGNRADTWANVRAYQEMPGVREILVLHSDAVAADLLRRGEDGGWPEMPVRIAGGDLSLASIGFTAPLTALYRTTRLARD